MKYWETVGAPTYFPMLFSGCLHCVLFYYEDIQEVIQWRREVVCRPGQTSVLPPPPIRSVLQSGYFFRISDTGCEPTLGVPVSFLPSPSVSHSYVLTTSPPQSLRSSPLNSVRRSGERCKFPQRYLGQSPGRN